MADMPRETMSSFPHISSKGLILLGVFPTMTFLASVCVFLRFLSRYLASAIQIDDWVCLIARLSNYGAMVSSVLFVTIGHAGYHVQEFSPSNLATYVKVPTQARSVLCSRQRLTTAQLSTACLMTSNISISLTKTSILIFYQRLFALHQNLTRTIWVLHILVVGYLITSICGNILVFDPVKGVWKPWTPHPSLAVNAIAMGYILGAINAFLDFLLLLLPQRAVWAMRMGRRQKLLVSGVFMLGAMLVDALQLVEVANSF